MGWRISSGILLCFLWFKGTKRAFSRKTCTFHVKRHVFCSMCILHEKDAVLCKNVHFGIIKHRVLCKNIHFAHKKCVFCTKNVHGTPQRGIQQWQNLKRNLPVGAPTNIQEVSTTKWKHAMLSFTAKVPSFPPNFPAFFHAISRFSPFFPRSFPFFPVFPKNLPRFSPFFHCFEWKMQKFSLYSVSLPFC